jgi:hypothetical protein
MSIKLKPITETSWLVIGDTDETRIGLLTEIREKYVLMAQGQKTQFINRKEVNKFFEEDVFENLLTAIPNAEIKKTYYINSFPVDFTEPFEVILKGNSLPLFSKKQTSDVYYSAGYYCLNFPKNWMPAYCPKLSTLKTYTYAGPFKTEIEMRSNLIRMRKEKNRSKA